jgi:hypothetical protein
VQAAWSAHICRQRRLSYSSGQEKESILRNRPAAKLFGLEVLRDSLGTVIDEIGHPLRYRKYSGLRSRLLPLCLPTSWLLPRNRHGLSSAFSPRRIRSHTTYRPHPSFCGCVGNMSTKTEIQALLRFLAQDAKVPLPTAMGKVKDLQAANMTRFVKYTPKILIRLVLIMHPARKHLRNHLSQPSRPYSGTRSYQSRY